MTAPAAALSREEKQALLRKVLAERMSRPRTVPASFAQERLWVLDRVAGAGAAYNIHLALRVPGAVDVPALERAVGELVRRHEALRTTFAEVDGAPVQVIAPFSPFTLPVEALPGGDEAAVRRRAAEEQARPFDLATGPLFRATLLRLAPDDHALLMVMHHIVSDGWSSGVMATEVAELYQAFREGKPSPLDEPTMQYADYAVQQRERLRGPALERELAYWRARLAGAPALLELPTDRPHPPVQSYRGATHRLAFEHTLLEKLEALARGEGATLHMLLLGAWQVLLGKYAGTDDVVVGAPVAGRGRRELEDLVGFFINTVALRTDLSGDPTFRALLKRVRGVALGAYTHQELPFERLVAELRPERSLRHTPVVQVMFTMDAADPVQEEMPGMHSMAQDPDGSSKFDLTLALESRTDGLRGSLDYSTDLFDAGTIARMALHLRRLLEGIARDPDARLSALALDSAEERRRVVEEWNDTATAYPRDAGIPALFQTQAARTPDATAVVYGDVALTYAELNARANRLARHLARAGVGPEARVAICLERGAELVVAMLAILKAGAAYVPLEPGYPPERLAWMLADAGAAVLVTQESLRAAVPVSAEMAVVSVDGDAAPIAAERADDFASAAGPRSLAYVIYTSGSTGTPKGAGIEHRGIVRLVVGTGEHGVHPGERIAQVSTPTFDAATYEIWAALLNGGTLVGISRDVMLAPERLEAALRENAIDHLLLTTAVFNAMGRERPGAFRGMRTVCSGGEAAGAEAMRRVLEAGGPRWVLNVYGPTENTAFSTTYVVDDVPADAASVPIGRPVPNSTAYVLDAALRPVPAGLPGELCTGGDGVARGYLGRPALTAERFVPDPFAATPGARMYRTGDRVRWGEVRECESAKVREWDEDKDSREGASTFALSHSRTFALEFLGRLDGQVKIRGFRIEPGEIEAALLRHPDVAECIVIAREDGSGGRRLVAYVAGAAEADALQAHLRRTLPDYMVPSAFVVLDRLPLAASGKVDRRALPEPEHAAGEYVPPRTATEEVLAAIWGEVLGMERVSADAGFFALGGHSLLAARVMSRVRAALGVEPTMRALFEAPTLAALAAAVDALRDGGQPRIRVERIHRDRPLPLSFAQERLWVIDRLQPGLAVYNVPAGVRLGGALNVPALERALGEIVRRHEVLRTTFGQHDGAPVQVIAPFDGFALPVEDLSALDDGVREEAVPRRARDDAARPFDLSRGPLFRAVLLRLGADEHVLLLCMHHAVTDGWSLGVLFRELAALYGAFSEGLPSPLEELPVQYAEHAVWERNRLQGAVLEGHLAYWRQTLAGAPALLELPVDHPRPAVQGTEGASVSVDLSAALLRRLNALGRAEWATPFMVLLGAFQVLLSRYSGSDDVVVGSPASGRGRRELEGLIGFFVNTLVLRTDLSGDPSFREVVRRAREAALGAYDHQEMPFERLVAELQPERSLGHSPLFQVLFALQNDDLSGGDLPGLRTEPFGADFDMAKFDLSLMFGEHAGGLWGTMTYRTDLFQRATIERMMGHLRRVLEQVAGNPDLRLSELELLDDGERRMLLESWSGTDAPYPADACIHQLFEARAARTPDAVAIVHEAESVTYAALNARANRIAHHLRRLGVGGETRVGICLPRGVEMVAALLGVLKAGGAYVPLDPAYPLERLAFMLADSAAAVLVTADALRGVLPARDDVRIVSLDRAAAEIAAESADDPAGGVDARSLAYLIYTSGSTGVPKGVAIEHRSAVAMLAWAAEVWTADDLHGMLASTSICFDISVYELFLPLSRGGRVILVENALALAHCAAADQVRLVNTVPSAIAALLRDDAIPAGVRTVNLAGELLRQELVDAVYAHPGVERVYDLYGPSEDTTYSTFALRRPGGAPGVGRTIHNTHGYVVDAGLRLVPPGVAGELCLAGKGLARGYLGRPALTAARFIPDPFATEPGARMYRTGDRIRWAPDGEGALPSLRYLGRMDQQVKVRGFRIEPGEIEAVLRRHPRVADCVVVARADESGERRLAAYVVGTAQPDEMRAHLRHTLPEYMVPGAFVRLDALPLTPSGKVDRNSLPAPEAVEGDEPPAEARTPVEEVLAGIWAGVLKAERVGPDDNFFQLGGHSLLATVVVARVQEVLGVRLPLSALFTAPTVAELAGEVEALRRAELPPLPPVVPVDRTDALPLSFAQERLWFLDRLQPESAFYNVPMALWLAGALDVGALEHALGEVVRRHEVLRTTFRERDGAPSLSIAPFTGWTLPVDDVAGADEHEVIRRASAEASRPFDLGAGPLFRARLLRLAADEHVLLLTLHHTVSDEWSLGVLFREMSAAYAAARHGTESTLPALPVQYADYAVWQREQLSGDVLDRQLAYWRARLAGAPALLELPIDHPRPALQSYRGARERFELSAELLGRLEALGRGEGATLFMVMLGALQVLLAKYSGSDDVVVGSPITGRTRHEVEGLIGFFTNTLVLRTDLSGDPGFRDVLRRVREATLGAYDHQDVPFERLVEALQPERSLGHSPLFQVMLIQGSGDGAALELPGVAPRPFGAGTQTSKFDLTLAVTAHADGIAGSIEYNTDLFERATVLRMIGHLRRVLDQLSADADAPLSRLELLGDEERRLVTETWNATDAPYPADACVHHLVQAQAERTPESVAVLHGGASLTYGELNEGANRLAHRLRALGVGPEVRVGICLERGPAMVVAVLAVLKAGGAYVPMDPAYPAPRLAFMATDSAVPVLLTQQSLRHVLPAISGVRVLCVDAPAPDGPADHAANPESGAGPANLAFVLYTSGSTGTPKGVAMPHGALVNLVAWNLGEPLRTLQFSSLSFDVSFQEIAATLASGGTLVLVDDALRRDPDALLGFMARHRVERLFLPFVALQALAEAAAAPPADAPPPDEAPAKPVSGRLHGFLSAAS